MKRTAFIFFTCSILVIAITAIFSRKGIDRQIFVVPNGREIPHSHPLKDYREFAQFINERGYRAKWLKLDALPKKHHYLTRLKNYILNQPRGKVFIFHNYHPFFSKAKIDQLPRGNRILIMWEPPSVLLDMYRDEIQTLFDKVYTWNSGLVDGKKYFKMCYPALRPMRDDLPSFKDRKLLCMIASNLKFNDFEQELYSTRKELARFFESKPKEIFDLYGRGWEGFRRAKGRIPDKHRVLKEYQFNICFENTKQPGYITEKIFDCFMTGTIPIYYGATNIEKYIPKGCYIDYRQFKSPDEMLNFIQHFKEEEYEAYVKNMKAYLSSEQAQQFSLQAFEKILMDGMMLD